MINKEFIFFMIYAVVFILTNVIFLIHCTSHADVKKGTGANFNHIYIGTKPVQTIKKGNTIVWQAVNPPSILTFTATPSAIDLDTRSTGNITISWTAASQSNIQTSRVYLQPQGTRIGQTFVTGSGAGVSESFTNAQPNQTQIYRVVINNSGGASYRDATVTVTQNAGITNFRRTAFQQAPGLQAGTFWFKATITGYPRPTLSYRFGNGRQGAISNRHLTPAGSNSWTLDWNIYHTVLADSLVLTATKSPKHTQHTCLLYTSPSPRD